MKGNNGYDIFENPGQLSDLKPDDINLSNMGNFIHSQSTNERAFDEPSEASAISLLYTSDADILKMVLRYDLPSNDIAVAAACEIIDCKEHKYVEGIEWVLITLGLVASRHGKRTDRAVSAIIGDKEFSLSNRMNNANNMMDSLKNKLGGG